VSEGFKLGYWYIYGVEIAMGMEVEVEGHGDVASREGEIASRDGEIASSWV
jgi:hypothetical protein